MTATTNHNSPKSVTSHLHSYWVSHDLSSALIRSPGMELRIVFTPFRAQLPFLFTTITPFNRIDCISNHLQSVPDNFRLELTLHRSILQGTSEPVTPDGLTRRVLAQFNDRIDNDINTWRCICRQRSPGGITVPTILLLSNQFAI